MAGQIPSPAMDDPHMESSGSEAAEAPIVAIRSLFKSFEDVMILKGINFTVNEGDLVSIIGPSGCGKSTLLRCMNFLEIPDSGTVSVAGGSLTRTGPDQPFDADIGERARALRSKVGMVFQAMNLFPHKTILENVTLAPIVVKGMVGSPGAISLEVSRDPAQADRHAGGGRESPYSIWTGSARWSTAIFR